LPDLKWKVSHLGAAEEEHELIRKDQISNTKILQAKPNAIENKLRNSLPSCLLPAFQGGLNLE